MKKSLITAAAAIITSSASADILLSDFSFFELSGTYNDWQFGIFTSGAEDFRVEATNFGGGWLFLDAPIDGSSEDLLEVVVTANPDNQTTAFNVVLFSDAGGSNWTEAGFTFEVQPGTQTLTADLWNPDFFNRGDINTWNPGDIWDQWHLQGTFANSDVLDLTFDNLALITGAGGLSLDTSGSCPGSFTATVTGATPNSIVALIAAQNTGSVQIPNGNPCAGTVLGLDRSAFEATRTRSDGAGNAVFSQNVPAAACGLFIQALDAASCGTTNVEQVL